MDRVLATIEEHNPKMNALDLGQSAFGNSQIVRLAEAMSMNKYITTLDLSSNNIAKDAAVALAALISTSPCLKTLNLHDNRIGSFAGIQDIAGALLEGDQSGLTEIDLSRNWIRGSLDFDALEQMGYATLRDGAILAVLDLSENMIDQAGMRALRKGIASADPSVPRSLRELKLTRCFDCSKDSRKILYALSDIIKTCALLRYLEVQHNGLTKEECKKLSAIMYAPPPKGDFNGRPRLSSLAKDDGIKDNGPVPVPPYSVRVVDGGFVDEDKDDHVVFGTIGHGYWSEKMMTDINGTFFGNPGVPKKVKPRRGTFTPKPRWAAGTR